MTCDELLLRLHLKGWTKEHTAPKKEHWLLPPGQSGIDLWIRIRTNKPNKGTVVDMIHNFNYEDMTYQEISDYADEFWP